MPELPEVQTTVNGIQRHIAGLKIKDAWTDYNSKFHTGKDNVANPLFFAQLRKRVKGAKVIKSSRRGKNVLIHLSNGTTILIHMKMTGHVMYGPYTKTSAAKDPWKSTGAGPMRDDPYNRFIHFVLSFTNGKSMVLSDMRKFAKVTLIDTDKLETSSHLSAHGPEPLEKSFGVEQLKTAVMRKPNGPIKTVLMNPEVVSGIGNIYSDEILWSTGIHPLEQIKNVPNKKWSLVWKAIQETLNKGIDFGGDSMSDYRNIHGERGKFQGKHNAYRKTGMRCGKSGCKGTIIRLKIGGRSAHFCDTHQKLNKR
jgi:formamidopyrimidine-DNA glycosylase